VAAELPSPAPPPGRTPPEVPRPHLSLVIGQVARSALQAAGAAAIVILDDGSPEATLAAALLAEALPSDRLERVDADAQDLEPVLRYARANAAGEEPAARMEALRFRARLRKDGLVACAVNKTALLLAPPPPDPFLPLGDVYATQVQALAGGCSMPEGLAELVEMAGGIEPLDAALFRRLDLRMPSGLVGLPDEARRAVEKALTRQGHFRRYPVVVPKIGPRTVGVDLHE
jgi:hypothetical protein